MPPTNVLQVVTNALTEIGAYAQGDVVPAADGTFGLSKLRRMLDSWVSDNLYIYAVDYLQLILVQNVQPLLIGEGVAIKSVSSNGTNATYVGNNNYQEGDVVSVGGIGTIGGNNFNATAQIVAAATPINFQLINGGAVVASTLTPLGQAIYSTQPIDVFELSHYYATA